MRRPLHTRALRSRAARLAVLSLVAWVMPACSERPSSQAQTHPIPDATYTNVYLTPNAQAATGAVDVCIYMNGDYSDPKELFPYVDPLIDDGADWGKYTGVGVTTNDDAEQPCAEVSVEVFDWSAGAAGLFEYCASVGIPEDALFFVWSGDDDMPLFCWDAYDRVQQAKDDAP